MANSSEPRKAYRGDESYVFVSYAHTNAATVYPEIALLQDAGLHVYYDEGITPGSRWTTELADAIERCSLFIAFLSPAAVASENCTNEIEFAVSRKRSVLVVHLEDTQVPPGLELSLGGRQALIKQSLDPETYLERLTKTAQTMLSGDDAFLPRQSTSDRGRRTTLIICVAILLAGLFLGFFVQQDTVKPDLRLAIAVRPFDTPVGAPEARFFADGIADDLVMRLGQWRALPIIARGSSFSTDLPSDPIAIGQALDARYLLEGAVAATSDSVRIDVYLVDAVDGRNVWSQVFEHPLDDVVATQAVIADAIVSQVNPALITAETRRAVRADPSNLDAWSTAMRGWWHLNTETRAGLTEADIWFQRAAELDPTWSWPHSAMALSAYRAVINGWSDNAKMSVGRLIQAANKAVQLDSRDPFAHHALGHAYAMQGQIDQSLNALERGVELAPNDPMANGCYAMQLAASALSAEALTVIDHVTALSPDDPWQHRFALVRARAHFSAGTYPEAEQWALRSLQLQPTTGAFLHSVAAPALGDGIDRARQRAESARAERPLPPLAGVERGFSRNTDLDYVARLIEGLRRAGFE